MLGLIVDGSRGSTEGVSTQNGGADGEVTVEKAGSAMAFSRMRSTRRVRQQQSGSENHDHRHKIQLRSCFP